MNFTFRKSNYGGRLEEGYWFYGNENYLAVSFWTGMDWRNRTPNIIFVIDKNEHCRLEFNCTDSFFKQKFVELEFSQALFLNKEGRRYVKEYSHDYKYGDEFSYRVSDQPDYIRFLDFFINEDKLIIDTIINRSKLKYREQSDSENAIFFIPDKEFNKRHEKIKKYREAKFKLDADINEGLRSDKPDKLLSININDYGAIDDITIDLKDRPANQWIFLTGANGSGKTNLLRAIATGLGHRLLTDSELKENPNFKIKAEFIGGSDNMLLRSGNNGISNKKRPFVQGLAMYGPYRLDLVNNTINRPSFLKKLLNKRSFDSLFNPSIKLLSIERQFKIWREGSEREQRSFERRQYYFKSVLTSITPGLVDVKFRDHSNKLRATQYIFESDNGIPEAFKWNQLSSGVQSTISMLGDILIRLFDQQREVIDPSELRGIVIIDEIDLHLHPLAQRNFVVTLSDVFPKVQFIVSTHSPIPILGAPKNSVFFKVSRKSRKVRVERLAFLEKHIGRLSPNQLFTSELFEVQDISSVQLEDEHSIASGLTMSSFLEMEQRKAEGQLLDPQIDDFVEKLRIRKGEKGK